VIASNAVYAYYTAAGNFISPISLVSSATVNALFPAFAALDGIGGDIKATFRHVYKFVAFLMAPLVFFLIVSSPVLIRVFYGASFSGSIPYLALLAVANTPIAFGYNVHPAFFNGFDKTRLTMYLSIAAGITLVVLAPLMSIEFGFGVDGLIYSVFISNFVGWAVGVTLAFTRMGATMDSRHIGAILLVSVLSAACTYFFPRVPFSNVLTLLVYVIVYFGVYLTLAPLARAINKWDVDMLETTFKNLGFINEIISPLFKYERFLTSLVDGSA
jgi:O-antigen/teichoic acid export membrane protein